MRDSRGWINKSVGLPFDYKLELKDELLVAWGYGDFKPKYNVNHEFVANDNTYCSECEKHIPQYGKPSKGETPCVDIIVVDDNHWVWDKRSYSIYCCDKCLNTAYPKNEWEVKHYK